MSKDRNGPEDSTKKPPQAASNLGKLVMQERFYQEGIGIDIIVVTIGAARSTSSTAQPRQRKVKEAVTWARKW